MPPAAALLGLPEAAQGRTPLRGPAGPAVCAAHLYKSLLAVPARRGSPQSPTRTSPPRVWLGKLANRSSEPSIAGSRPEQSHCFARCVRCGGTAAGTAGIAGAGRGLTLWPRVRASLSPALPRFVRTRTLRGVTVAPWRGLEESQPLSHCKARQGSPPPHPSPASRGGQPFRCLPCLHCICGPSGAISRRGTVWPSGGKLQRHFWVGKYFDGAPGLARPPCLPRQVPRNAPQRPRPERAGMFARSRRVISKFSNLNFVAGAGGRAANVATAPGAPREEFTRCARNWSAGRWGRGQASLSLHQRGARGWAAWHAGGQGAGGFAGMVHWSPASSRAGLWTSVWLSGLRIFLGPTFGHATPAAAPGCRLASGSGGAVAH